MAPTVEEVMLAAKFGDDGGSNHGGGAAGAPPFYAVAARWFDAWRLFVAGEAPPPGPVANGPLVDGRTASTPRTARADDVVWLQAEDWRLLHARHGGGPVLRRASMELFPAGAGAGQAPGRLTDAGDAAGDAEGERLRTLLHEARGPLTAACGGIGRELAAEAVRLREGPWSRAAGRRSSRPADRAAVAAQSATRSRVLEAAESQYGGEELKEALEALRPLEDAASLRRLDELMHRLCALEEAQVATACLLQALQDSDRLGVELWLEQVDAMGLEGLLAGSSGEERWVGLSARLRAHHGALEERERRALDAHAGGAQGSGATEEPQERLWRQTVFAVEANDEQTLSEVIHQAEVDGLDATAAKLAREELRARSGKPPLVDPPDGSYLGQDDDGPWAYGVRPPRWGSHAYGGEDDYYARLRERQAEERAEREAERRRASDEFERMMGENQRRWAEERRAREQEERARAEARRREQDARQRQREEDRRRQEEESSQRYRREREEYERWRQRQSAPPPRPPPSYASYAYLRPGVSDALRSLGLPPGSVPPVADIKAAYKRAALRCHPDRPQNRDRQAEATAEFQRVKQAFDLLVPSSGA